MKRIFLSLVIIILIFEILMFPKEAMSYAAAGLSLWFDNMVPALFPFMVISGLIIRLDLAPCILSLLHPLLYKIFHTNVYCEYAIVMGLLCGYPMGAVIVRDLLEEHKINIAQAEYLLAFCNNIGPVFFFTLALPLFTKECHLLLLLGMYGIPLVYGILLRYTFYKKVFSSQEEFVNIKEPEEKPFAPAFTDALNQAVSASLFLGACMIFFNMLRFLPTHYFGSNPILQTFISWTLEVNGALFLTGDLYTAGKEIITILMMPLLCIGGLSCLCQTAGILATTNCSLSRYFIHKCIQCFLWFALTLLWLLICNLGPFYG